MKLLKKGFFILCIVLFMHGISWSQVIGVVVSSANGVTTICDGDSIQLFAYVTVGATTQYSFQWVNNSSLSNSTIQNPYAKPTTTTTYEVIVKELATGKLVRDDITITVQHVPVIDFGSATVDTTCTNQPYTFQNVSLLYATEFSWIHNGAGIMEDTNTLSPVYIPGPDEFGTVEIILKSQGNESCRQVADTMQLIVQKQPFVQLQSKSATICSNEMIVMQEPVFREIQSFVWTHNGKGQLLKSNTFTPEYFPLVGEAGAVDIVLHGYGKSPCVVATDTFKLTIFPNPVVSIKDAAVNICNNNVYLFNNVTIQNSNNYFWTHNGAGTLLNSQSLTPEYVPLASESGEVTFVLTGTSIFQCASSTDTLKMTIYDHQSVNLTENTTICAGTPITLSVDPGHTYLWSTGETTSSIIVRPTETTDYMVEATNLIGCVVYDTVTVTVSHVIYEATPDITICGGEIVDLTVNANAGYSYLWSTGETTNTIAVQPEKNSDYSVIIKNQDACSDTADINVMVREIPTITVEESFLRDKTIEVSPSNYVSYSFNSSLGIVQSGPSNTFYYGSSFSALDTIYIKVVDNNGCSNSMSAGTESPDYFIAPNIVNVNAFSPNGDGINDVFLRGRRVVIFDRSSKVLYDGFNGWDGRSNNKDMPAGTYFHIAYDHEGNIVYKGPVSIVR